MSFTLQNPFQYWNNPNNSNPVGLGKLYVGKTDLDPVPLANQVTVKALQQDGTEITLSQPIQLLAGGVPSFNGSPVQLKIEVAEVSIKLTTMQGAQVYYAARFSLLVDYSLINTPLGTLKKLMDNRKTWINVKDYGAVGDGVSDDTAAIQSAVNAAIAFGGGAVLFPSGTYQVVSVNIQHGLELVGNGNSVIRRPNNQPNWTRTFTTQNNLWDSTSDSPPLVIRDLIFDGNRSNQGEYTGYQLEQAHLLFLTAQTTKAGRLRAFVENCHFIECVADGTSQFTNVDLTITDCYMRNCFRGGLVVTGGFSRLRASNLIMKGEVNARSIDFEIDGGGFGGSLDVVAELTNIDTNSHFDVSVGGNSRVVCDNINFGDISNVRSFTIAVAGNAKLQISNSTFLIAAGALNQMRFVSNISFSNVNFLLTNFGSVTGQTIGIEVYSNDKRLLKMNNCDFSIQAGSALADNFTPIFHTAGSSAEHKTILSNCSFGAGIDTAVAMSQGGYLAMDGCYMDSSTGVLFGGATGFPCEVYLSDCSYGANNQFNYNQGSDNAHTSLSVDGLINASDYAFTGIGGSNWRYSSSLVVAGDAADPNTPLISGVAGDTYKQRTQPIYGAGSNVLWVGSRLAVSPFFEWVPVKRD